MDVLMVISFFGLPISLVVFLVQLLRKKPKSKKIWGSLTIFFTFLLVISSTSALSNKDTQSQTSTPASSTMVTENEESTEPTETNFEFSDADQKILTDLGLTYVHDMEVTENDRHTIIRGKIFDSDDLQLNITQEDGKIIYVQLSGIVEDNDVVSNRSDKLKLDVGLQGKKAVDMYSDTDGVLAVLNWQDKTLTNNTNNTNN